MDKVRQNYISYRILISAFTLVLFIEFIAGIIIKFQYLSPLSLIGIVRVIETISILLILIIFGDGLKSIGIYQGRTLEGLKKGTFWSISIGLIVFIGFACIYFAGINPLKLFKGSIGKNLCDIVEYFIVGGLIAPIAEEIFFRGILFTSIRPFGFIPALIFSTIIFAVLHIPDTGIPVTQVIGGIIFSVAFEKEKNLLVPMAIHIAANVAIFGLTFI